MIGRLILALAALLVAGGIGWGAAQIVAPAATVPPEAQFTTVEVRHGRVAFALNLVASVRWREQAAVTNQSTGIVTTIGQNAGDLVSPGDVLYTVDMRPVVIARGQVPNYRSMKRGDHGVDVAQLQRLLGQLGFYAGADDGEFEAVTESAVKAWQDSLEVHSSGVVQMGDIAFVPDLPAQVILDPAVVATGRSLVGGEVAIQALAQRPALSVTVTNAQNDMITANTPIVLRTPAGGTWPARIVSRDPLAGADGFVLRLTGTKSVDACGVQCLGLTAGRATSLPANVHVVPATRGSIIPAAALQSDARGEVAVTLFSGEPKRVTLRAESNGDAVVDGLKPGDVVRIPIQAG